jgi:hypothetical protein
MAYASECRRTGSTQGQYAGHRQHGHGKSGCDRLCVAAAVPRSVVIHRQQPPRCTASPWYHGRCRFPASLCRQTCMKNGEGHALQRCVAAADLHELAGCIMYRCVSAAEGAQQDLLAHAGIQLLQSLLIHAPQVHRFTRRCCLPTRQPAIVAGSGHRHRLGHKRTCRLQEQSRLWLHHLLVDACIEHGRLAQVTAAAWHHNVLYKFLHCMRLTSAFRCRLLPVGKSDTYMD